MRKRSRSTSKENGLTLISPTEEWRDIPGWEDRYQVSNLGRVRSIRTLVDGTVTERILKQRPLPKGHLRVALCKDGVCSDYRVHNLVLLAFVGPRPDGCVGCHWDDDPTNNHLSNLRWGTHTENHLDRVRNGIHPGANKTECPYGHPYAGENLRIAPNGQRVCRSCAYGRHRKHRHGDDPVEMANYYFKEFINAIPG